MKSWKMERFGADIDAVDLQVLVSALRSRAQMLEPDIDGRVTPERQRVDEMADVFTEWLAAEVDANR